MQHETRSSDGTRRFAVLAGFTGLLSLAVSEVFGQPSVATGQHGQEELIRGGDISAAVRRRLEFGLVPIGAVVAFWGSLEEIKLLGSYELCDGNLVQNAQSPLKGRPRPNLRDRFIMGCVDQPDLCRSPVVGGTNTTDVVQLGRTLPHQLTVEQMASHNHSGTTGSKGGDSISAPGRLVQVTGHFHPTENEGGGGDGSMDIRAGTFVTPTLPSHAHSIGTEGGNKGHDHALPPIPTSDNRPAFLAMYFIMRVL